MSRFAQLFLVTFAFVAAPTLASAADVCIAVDDTHDTLTPADRTAAVLLLTRQFELMGEHVTASCESPFFVSHIALGRTIVVTLDGRGERREGTALGMEDLPALYNQMVRSIVTGRPMSGLSVVDRTNVTAAQASVERVPTDSFWYARLGYGGIFGDRAYGTPAIGMGYRVEMDSFGVDISFLNYQIGANESYYNSTGAFAGSLLKLQGLYFLNPTANRSPYFGAGLSWGGTNFGSGFNGSGLQGELSAGYELPRASTLRAFIQADGILPFYRVTANRYSAAPYYDRRNVTVTTDQRYAPSFVVSLGLGWQKNRHRR
jgi:hypothetical protein